MRHLLDKKEIDMRTRGRPSEGLGGVGDMAYDSTGPPTPRENFLVKHIRILFEKHGPL
jgi:hypothetical protein